MQSENEIGAKLNFSSKALRNLKGKFCWTKIKIEKLFMHTFQNIAHLLGPKNQYGHFWGRGSACCSLKNTQLNVTNIESVHTISCFNFKWGHYKISDYPFFFLDPEKMKKMSNSMILFSPIIPPKIRWKWNETMESKPFILSNRGFKLGTTNEGPS